MPPPPPPPTHFVDLFDEDVMKIIYGLQHNDRYDDALKLAGSKGKGFGKAFHNLLKAAEAEYKFGIFGFDVMPKPKVHLLHRELLDIAARLKLDRLTNDGLEELFDDICPCARKHKAEAIRKLRKRVAGKE